jgi:putative transposase
VVLSLGRTGRCWDNALAESSFASLKGELIDLQAWPTLAAAPAGHRQLHRLIQQHPADSTLGYRSPAEYEAAAVRRTSGK